MRNNNQATREKLYNIIDMMISNGDIKDTLEIHVIYDKLKKCCDNIAEKIADKKYEVTDITEYRSEREVHRIRVLKDFGMLRKVI